MPDKENKTIILIAGPTASGKSALALEVAKNLDGEVINADAMQVYRDLHVLTARPSAEDVREVPHHLYGGLGGEELCSAGVWAGMAVESIQEIRVRHKCPIMVGGTGLYFKALVDGLSPIPAISEGARMAAMARHCELGAEAFRMEVVARDPAMDWLPPSDTQRLLRAWEVFHETGKTLSSFQALPRQKLIDADFKGHVLMPPREVLYGQCDARAAAMFDEGALAEVETLLTKGLPESAPVMKSLGVREIADFLSGAATKDEALAMLQQNTRRFAKRQMTWFRNQTADWFKGESAEEVSEHIYGGENNH